ncbi:UbiA family prenyltransferase [Streptacidiphilus sp. PB12-B1b]|uniref:UbiA family prenyltransferase n=1 Tax=Streptacidiphilus sp. PB12-B1b TaxID=2705012 RepID=UPI0015FD6C73|nr:UbiA family prenyltransferase [Streptacidiphilus sp. PB12-B1b]QMU77701.1 UbiA family prenyltransferase [Streptacidiphilus sp. PB12-B1b]
MSSAGTPDTTAGPAPAGSAPASAPVGGPGRRALGLVRAAHAPPTAAVTALITLLALAAGRDPVGAVLVALAVLTGQLSVGWSNDRIDLRRDLAADRRDKPLVTGVVSARDVSVGAGTALALCIPLSLASGLPAGAAHLAGVAAAWAYNLGVKRTLLSWLPYALGFGLLPAFVTLGLPGHPWPPVWLPVAGALLGIGAHITNVLPDIDADLAAGVRGLPQRLGAHRSRSLAAAALLAASAVLVLGPAGRPGAVGWAGLVVTGALGVAVVLPFGAGGGGAGGGETDGRGAGAQSRVPFLATLGLAGVDVALLLLRGAALR